jgi:lambda family phage tail tape measure protein
MAMNMDAMLRIKADVQGENNIRRLGNSMQGLQGQAKNVALSFNNLKGAVAGFGAAIAGSAIVGGLSAVVKKSIDAGDELFNLQAKTGIAATALTGIGNAAKLADVDIGTLGKGINKFNLNLVKAAEGNTDLARQFQQLGVNVKDTNGQLIPTDKALKQIADKFADMPDGAKKAQLAVALFGKSGAELIPLLNEGAASMEKFTYKISDDFAARSDLFNDTLTEFGIKVQGFGMELTDALLPALQSILEVFGDLFDSKQDWTALFELIKGGLRTIATVIYATIKLVDQLIKAAVHSFDAIGKALKGDFAAAGEALSKGFGAGLDQAKRDFAQIQKLWTDAPSPGTGRRSGRTALDMSGADAQAAAEAKRAANEAERLQQKRNNLTQQFVDLQQSLARKIEDVNAAFKNVGATPVEKLLADRADALRENDRTVDDLTMQVVKLFREIRAAGGEVDIKPLEKLINQLSQANADLAQQQFTQGLKDLLPSLEDYDAKIREVQQGKQQLTEVEKLNSQINLLQLDILAATNPELAKHVALLRDRAAALDAANKKQKEQEDSFGANFNEKIKAYYESISNFGAQVGDAVINTFQGLEDQLTSFVTTGKANFTDLANSIIADIARIAIRQAIIKPLVGGVMDIFNIKPSAMGNVFAQNGIQKFARGGIVDKPTMFPFANGIGLMGEAGPEAIMPLRRGRDGRLGVQAANGGGAVSVMVNVDASGSNVQGDNNQAGQLGKVIGAAVQAELIKQRRPGGLLA